MKGGPYFGRIEGIIADFHHEGVPVLSYHDICNMMESSTWKIFSQYFMSKFYNSWSSSWHDMMLWHNIKCMSLPIEYCSINFLEKIIIRHILQTVNARSINPYFFGAALIYCRKYCDNSSLGGLPWWPPASCRRCNVSKHWYLFKFPHLHVRLRKYIYRRHCACPPSDARASQTPETRHLSSWLVFPVLYSIRHLDMQSFQVNTTGTITLIDDIDRIYSSGGCLICFTKWNWRIDFSGSYRPSEIPSQLLPR